jgi:hypothetical protein
MQSKKDNPNKTAPAANTDAPNTAAMPNNGHEDVYDGQHPEPFDEADEATTGPWYRRPSDEPMLTVRNDTPDEGPLQSEMGSDLDVPGAELDDELELTGDEDEENNYYSIGGDNHHELEESDGG